MKKLFKSFLVITIMSLILLKFSINTYASLKVTFD